MGNDEPQPDFGHAGRSARREAERRHQRRLRRASECRRGWLARTLVALLGPSAAQKRELARERAWATGAGGEEIVAAALAKRCPHALLLHDRKMPRSCANIDHLAVVPSGVYVIDTKRYRGKIQVRRPLLGAPSLRIAGRDSTPLLTGLHKQVDAVRSVLAEVDAQAPIRGCLCFVVPEGAFAEGGLPLLLTPEIDGFKPYSPRRLAKQLRRPGPLAANRIDELAGILARRFPPA